jgi:menaquinone-dependent protoporphyrinogen oxidase
VPPQFIDCSQSDRIAIDFAAPLAHHFASAGKVRTAADTPIPMPRILLLYATTEGQTGLIAERIARALREKAHSVDLLPADADPAPLDPAAYDGVMVGASIHYGRHPAYLRTLIRRHRDALAARPSAFFSVSLSAGGPRPKPKAAQRYLDKFLRQTGWRPQLTATIAGAVRYSLYGPIKRRVMIVFVGLGGGETNTSRDYEYTDWDAVDRFADAYAHRLNQA